MFDIFNEIKKWHGKNIGVWIPEGVILFKDAFDNGVINFLSNIVGTGSVALTNVDSEVYSGANAIKLTTGAVTGDSTEILVYLPVGFVNAFKKLRLFFKARFPDSPASANFQVILNAYAKPKRIRAGLYVCLDFGTAGCGISYIDENNNWADTGLTLPYDSSLVGKQWHDFLIELDLKNYTYGLVTVNLRNLGIVNKKFYAPDTDTLSYLVLRFKIQTQEAVSHSVILDNIYLIGLDFTHSLGILNPAPSYPVIVIG
jgi:hypothetical protein